MKFLFFGGGDLFFYFTVYLGAMASLLLPHIIINCILITKTVGSIRLNESELSFILSFFTLLSLLYFTLLYSRLCADHDKYGMRQVLGNVL